MSTEESQRIWTEYVHKHHGIAASMQLTTMGAPAWHICCSWSPTIVMVVKGRGKGKKWSLMLHSHVHSVVSSSDLGHSLPHEARLSLSPRAMDRHISTVKQQGPLSRERKWGRGECHTLVGTVMGPHCLLQLICLFFFLQMLLEPTLPTSSSPPTPIPNSEICYSVLRISAELLLER